MRNLLALLFITTSIVGVAQTIEREVVSANGNFYSNGVGQLSTTLGEPIISTVSSGTNELTQGFQQTRITITGIEDFQSDFEMSIYPNPVSEFITIKTKELKEGVTYAIYTIEGKLVLEDNIKEIQTKLQLSALVKGSYYLNITQENQLLKTYKIIKQ